MINYLWEQMRRNRIFQIISLLFIGFTIWWITIYYRGNTDGVENDWWANLMVVFPLLGGIAGLYYSRLWGGFKSALGFAIYMLSLGLLAQFIGTALYFFYVYVLGVEIPYPSLADVAYIASILFYIVGAYKLVKVVGVNLSSQSWFPKFLAIIIPLLILGFSYLALMRNYDFTEATALRIFLDFGWLIGQAIYVSIAIFAFIASKNTLGGMMRKPIILLLAALVVQYIADFQYSYQINNETYYTGGINDYFYALAFFLMTIAIFSIGNMFYKVQES